MAGVQPPVFKPLILSLTTSHKQAASTEDVIMIYPLTQYDIEFSSSICQSVEMQEYQQASRKPHTLRLLPTFLTSSYRP